MACKCGNSKCTGFYLLHSRELRDVPELKANELLQNPGCTFELLDNGDPFAKFYELHVREA